MSAANAVMTQHDGLAPWIEFGHPRWYVVHWNMCRAGKRREGDLPGFPDVKNDQTIAAPEKRVKFPGGYLFDFGHSGHLPSIVAWPPERAKGGR